jgi:hypothetical protein
MTKQFPPVFCIRLTIAFSGYGIPHSALIPWSIDVSVTGDAGFTYITDQYDIPTPPPHASSGVLFPSAQPPVTDPYIPSFSGNTADAGQTEWIVNRYVNFIPENTDAATQNYQITGTIHCDEAAPGVEADLSMSLKCWYQNDLPGQPSDGQWNNFSSVYFNPPNDWWWQGGSAFGEESATDFSYSGATHTHLVATAARMKYMILEMD